MYQGGQNSLNGNLGPPITNGVRPSYSGSSYALPVSNTGYSLPGVPPQHTPQNMMQTHSQARPVPPSMNGPVPSQQQVNPGYLNYSSTQSSLLPPVPGGNLPQQV